MPNPSTTKLGSLEADIMGFIWREKKALTVRDVVVALAKKRQSAYTTVMTVMNRLVAKGILKRQPNGGHYTYQAVQAAEMLSTRN
jgi:predicted transcriptional regulator